jgi:hypothetical protein
VGGVIESDKADCVWWHCLLVLHVGAVHTKGLDFDMKLLVSFGNLSHLWHWSK